MTYIRNFIFNALMGLIPISQFFSLKRVLANICGIKLSNTTRLSHNIKIFGGGQIDIGADTWVGINTKFYIPFGAFIRIGDFCDIAPDVIFQTGTHDIGFSHRRAGNGNISSICIGNGTWVGIRALILPGVKIGNGCIVAAGAVVIAGEYPDNVLLAGVPARIIKSLGDS
ncbi:acyltransferase [Iodobacter sp. HSC-16F04]|uniref:Acyltransferase n=1 Tax=Iodobacter violaceini TaxID=3044271 RepID=A0ABX0L187_9NEIS|nr:acyltransferase [Iodobacter violacea]NHQ88507.1 acyltransferase [Iodobacter violacea]